MILKPPFPLSTIVQHFGDNAVSFYTQGLGLKGHPGIDFGVPWGTDIPCAVDSYCYLVVRTNDPAFYQAVYTIVDEPDVSYEVSYGHCSSVSAVIGQNNQGTILGKVGNSGSVYSGGVLVSEQDKLNGSHAGAHLHFQVRRLKKVPVAQMDTTKHHVNNGQGLYTRDGFVYEVPEYDNGYNGCIDPAQFFPFMFNNILWFGMFNNDDVKMLQLRLGVNPTGFFGPLTLAAVRAYQKSHGISPTGLVGVLTRASLNGYTG